MRPRAPAWRVAILRLGLAFASGTAGAHAFPERSEPRVGAIVRTAPTRVQIWFDGDLEPAFSRLMVTDGRGERVDRGDSQVDPQNRRVLRVSLLPIPPGTYKVS
jgi:methionine-rich copper-binding protein CopC